MSELFDDSAAVDVRPRGSIAVIDADGTRRQRLTATLSAVLGAEAVVAVDPVAPGARCDLPFDVALVNIEDRNLDALCFAYLQAEALGRPEMVFFAACMSDPSVLAVREALRSDRLVPEESLGNWLLEASGYLTKLARARRIHQSATHGLQRVPLPHWEVPVSADVGLYEAEGRFREAYVRSLLLVEDTRKAAAERARVPYRTFIHILSKLGITERKCDRIA